MDVYFEAWTNPENGELFAAAFAASEGEPVVFLRKPDEPAARFADRAADEYRLRLPQWSPDAPTFWTRALSPEVGALFPHCHAERLASTFPSEGADKFFDSLAEYACGLWIGGGRETKVAELIGDELRALRVVWRGVFAAELEGERG